MLIYPPRFQEKIDGVLLAFLQINEKTQSLIFEAQRLKFSNHSCRFLHLNVLIFTDIENSFCYYNFWNKRCTVPGAPSDLTVWSDCYPAVVSRHIVKLGSLDIEEKCVWEPNKISVRSGQQNWLFKCVVQARVLPILTKEHVYGEILQNKPNGHINGIS